MCQNLARVTVFIQQMYYIYNKLILFLSYLISINCIYNKFWNSNIHFWGTIPNSGKIWKLQSDAPRCPCIQVKNKGDQAFSVAAPSLWNILPIQIRARTSEKSLLKTHIYLLAFNLSWVLKLWLWPFLLSLFCILFYYIFIQSLESTLVN